jgi:hypothetical protein
MRGISPAAGVGFHRRLTFPCSWSLPLSPIRLQLHIAFGDLVVNEFQFQGQARIAWISLKLFGQGFSLAVQFVDSQLY